MDNKETSTECFSDKVRELLKKEVQGENFNPKTDALIFIALSEDPENNSKAKISGACCGKGVNLAALAETLLTDDKFGPHFIRAIYRQLNPENNLPAPFMPYITADA